MVEASPKIVRFQAVHDEDADVWVATGDERITAEALTRDDLLVRLSVIVPDVLASRNEITSSITIVVDWQELRTVDQSTLALA